MKLMFFCLYWSVTLTCFLLGVRDVHEEMRKVTENGANARRLWTKSKFLWFASIAISAMLWPIGLVACLFRVRCS